MLFERSVTFVRQASWTVTLVTWRVVLYLSSVNNRFFWYIGESANLFPMFWSGCYHRGVFSSYILMLVRSQFVVGVVVGVVPLTKKKGHIYLQSTRRINTKSNRFIRITFGKIFFLEFYVMIVALSS